MHSVEGKLNPPNLPIRIARIALSSGRTKRHIETIRSANVISIASYLPPSLVSRIKIVRGGRPYVQDDTYLYDPVGNKCLSFS